LTSAEVTANCDFTSNPNYVFISPPPSPNGSVYLPFTTEVEMLIVGGGGGGGSGPNNGKASGGGGGGGVGMGKIKIYNEWYGYTTGAGGSANSGNGGDSIFKTTTNGNFYETAPGGGGGGSDGTNAGSGGSGGGGNRTKTNGGSKSVPTNRSITFYGNNGGTYQTQSSDWEYGAGGGGAFGKGNNINNSWAYGGNGIFWPISGQYYGGGGGGGGIRNGDGGGPGGLGGGGRGGWEENGVPRLAESGTAKTGGGGGGGAGWGWSLANRAGGVGGSGNIILAFSKTSLVHGLAYSYSLIKRTNEYNGSCINVRRDTDDTTIDIPFKNGILDISTLQTFSNNGNCYVTKWYDQVGLNNLIQPTYSLQPQIVSNGSVIVNNNMPVVSFDGSKYLISNLYCILYRSHVVNFVLSINTDTNTGLDMTNYPVFFSTEFVSPNNERNMGLGYITPSNEMVYGSTSAWSSRYSYFANRRQMCRLPSLNNIKGNVIIGTAKTYDSTAKLNLKIQNDKNVFVVDSSVNGSFLVGVGPAYNSKLIVGAAKWESTSTISGIPFYLYELNISTIFDPSNSDNNFNYLNNIQIQNYIQNNTSNYLNLQPNILTTNTGLTFNFDILSYKYFTINSVVFSLDTKNLVPNSIFPNELLNFNIGCDISSNYLRYYVLENNNTINVAFNSYKYVYFLSNITNDLSYNISLLSEAQTNLNLNQIQINYLSVNGDGSKIIYCDTGNNSLLYFTTYNFENKSWNPIQKTLNDIQLTSIKGLILNIDGSRGVCCFNNLFYYFTFYNDNYSPLNPILDTVTTRVYNNFDMTPDGNHIYACSTNGIFYSSWVSTNYSIFASKVTTSPVNAVAITNNSQILAYSTSAGVFYSIGSSFSSIVTIQSFTNNINQLKFAPYQNGLSILYAFTNNVGMYYWYVNIANNPVFSSSYYSIDTSIVPQNTNYTNISINSIGSQIYYTTLDGTAIKILNIPTISSKNINSLNSLTSKRIIADGSNNFNLSINMSSDGKTFIYINNVLDVSGIIQYPSSIVRNNSYIGCNTDNYNLLNGNMKSFQMYNKKMK
jgi:hypothetical protein